MTRGLRRQYETANGVRVVQVAHHAGGVRATLDGEEVPFDARRARRVEGGVELLISATAGLERAVVVRDGDTVHVHLRGRVHRLEVARRGAAGGHAAADEDERFAASPMTLAAASMTTPIANLPDFRNPRIFQTSLDVAFAGTGTGTGL